MPVEIRELVIQAKVLENAEANPKEESKAKSNSNCSDLEQAVGGGDQVDELVEKCIKRLQEWLNEKSMR